MTRPRRPAPFPRLAILLLLVVPLLPAALVAPAGAADGEMGWGLPVALAAKWLDPAETEVFNTPFMVLYAVHDAMVKPMPGGLEPYVASHGIYAYGSRPEIDGLYMRQGRELDPKKREALLAQIQKTLHDQVVNIPIYELAFIWGTGPRVEESGANRIPGFASSAPMEDLKLKAR